MKSLKVISRVFAFALAIVGAFAFNSAPASSVLTVNAYPTNACQSLASAPDGCLDSYASTVPQCQIVGSSEDAWTFDCNIALRKPI